MISTQEKYLIYFIACALSGNYTQTEQIDDLDLDKLYALAKHHSLSAIVGDALENMGFLENASPETAKKWQHMGYLAVRKNMLFTAEREKILAFMEENHIWYMPLKGIILQDLYPKFGMREMADNDILYDVTYQKELKNFMLGRGYYGERIGKGHHDCYYKKPFYNFEMHTSLMKDPAYEKLTDYYINIKDILIKDTDNQYGWHFSNEDFYIYTLAHAYKHFSKAGIGLRTLADVYLYNYHYTKNLDWEYIQKVLNQIDLTTFEADCRSLSIKLFSNSADTIKNIELLSEEEENMLLRMSQSGTYGNVHTKVKQALKELDSEETSKNKKIKYYMSRLIPSPDYFQYVHPFIYKHKILYPGFIVFRLIRTLISDRKRILYEIKTVENMSKIEQKENDK